MSCSSFLYISRLPRRRRGPNGRNVAANFRFDIIICVANVFKSIYVQEKDWYGKWVRHIHALFPKLHET